MCVSKRIIMLNIATDKKYQYIIEDIKYNFNENKKL